MSAADTGAAGTYVTRACCARGASQNRGFVQPADMPADENAVRAGGGDVLATDVTHVRKWTTAIHEAGHAVVTVRLGGGITSVSVDPPAQSCPRAPLVRDPALQMARILAGPIAERWAENKIVRLWNDQLAPVFAAVRAGVAGGCDDCRSMMLAKLAVMAKGGDEDEPEQVFAAWRDAELMAIEMVTKRPNFFPIIRLAKILMANGVASEDEVWSCLSEDMLSSSWPFEPEPEETIIWLT